MRKKTKRLLSGVLSLAMALSLVAVSPGAEGRTVQAESTSLISNGDFESDVWDDDSVWTITPDSWDNFKDAINNNAGAKKSGESGLGIYFTNSNTSVVLSQEVSLEAGEYELSGYTKETKESASTVQFLDGSDTALGDALTTSDTFQNFTGSFTLETAATYTVKIKVTGGEDAWVCLDDITLCKKESTSTEDEDGKEDENTDYYIDIYSESFDDTAGLDAWSRNWDSSSGSITDTVKENAWNTWSNDANAATFTQTFSGLTAGEYQISLVAVGASMGDCTVSLNSSAQPLTINEWGKSEPTTGSLTLTEDGDITITIQATYNGGGWCNFDDIVLQKKVTEQEKKTYELEQLDTLITSAEAKQESVYTSASWSVLQSALATAKALKEQETVTLTEIADAAKALSSAISNLEEDGIFVQKVEGLSEDFIRGVDISSYVSVTESGVTFKDFDGNVLDDAGFFKLLKESGVNYVRIRVWNDPYNTTLTNEDGTKGGYGGGNNDLEKAKIIGKLAADAGLKSLIDFHYSDFWADPERQYEPKAWKGYTLEQKVDALYDYTKDSLQELIDYGVDVGMVQIGNETNSAIAGVSRNDVGWEGMCKLFSAGSKAVRDVDKNIMVALHFTDPQTKNFYAEVSKALADNGVDYDVFASSYYPNIHGSMTNLTDVLTQVAQTYGKKVMVAETSWAWTTEDGDGHSQSFDTGSNSDYNISVQGQATVVRDVVEAVNNVKDENGDTVGIGVFYWEPAWLPVQYAYDENGKLDSDIYASNQEKWDYYGSGWASSKFSKEYDPEHGGLYGGGSVKDNESFFDFEGNPLASLTVFKDIYEGVSGPVIKLEKMKNGSVEVKLNNSDVTKEYDTIISQLPKTVTAIFNDSARVQAKVEWNKEEVNFTDFGNYTIKGTASVEYQGETFTSDVECDISVLPDSLLENGDFESEDSGWTVENADGVEIKWNDTPVRGEGAMHFWSGKDMNFTLTQTVTATESGIYCASMQLQGGDGSERDDINIKITNETQGTTQQANALLKGWEVWQKPLTGGMRVEAGDVLTLTITVNCAANAWGSIDDVFLYKTAGDNAISYELGGGVNSSKNLIVYNNGTSFTFNAPTRYGYTFDGWYLDKDYTTSIEAISEDTTGDLTLFAKWNPILATEISLNETDKEITVGETLELSATVKPDNAADLSVEWTSSDESVATVDANGVVTAKAEGDAVITAIAKGGDEIEAACKVKVNKAPETPTEPDDKEGEKTPSTTEKDETGNTDTTTVKPAEVGATVASAAGDKGTFTVTKAGSTPEVSYTAEKNATTVTIPATIKDANGVEYKVTSIVADSIKGNKKLKSVTIGSNVTSIPANAFKGCTSLTSVKISASVKTIGANAFSGDTKLKTVSMGSSVTTIGDKAFYNCKKLTKITIPKTVTKIGKQAFANCKALKTITIKTTKLTKSKVGSKAFKGINAKATIKVPKAKLKAYKTILKSRGVGSKVKIKKN